MSLSHRMIFASLILSAVCFVHCLIFARIFHLYTYGNTVGSWGNVACSAVKEILFLNVCKQIEFDSKLVGSSKKNLPAMELSFAIAMTVIATEKTST
jgi:hypothetical protein